ncbi:hypothetical protein C8J57DRAFT_1518612 [Mycena rebaudengoi]|nr:hypothetical protein C8J57DRAFT_1518612 [Mycena rebaudengoi]
MRKKLTASPAPFLLIQELQCCICVFSSAIPPVLPLLPRPVQPSLLCHVLLKLRTVFPFLFRSTTSPPSSVSLSSSPSFPPTFTSFLSSCVSSFSPPISSLPSPLVFAFVLFLSTLPGVFPSLPIHILRDPVSSSLPHPSPLSLPSRANDFSHQSSFAQCHLFPFFTRAPSSIRFPSFL